DEPGHRVPRDHGELRRRRQLHTERARDRSPDVGPSDRDDDRDADGVGESGGVWTAGHVFGDGDERQRDAGRDGDAAGRRDGDRRSGERRVGKGGGHGGGGGQCGEGRDGGELGGQQHV